ncbi:MAG: transcription antitermination factor NusB, partial [Evtepia sp.]
MTRSTAREIAVHCSYTIGFTGQSPEEILEERLNRDNFLNWKDEDAIYAEYPNEKQQQYIKELVNGVGKHAPELDEYIAQYAVNWKFARIPRISTAIMRVAMYEILYMPQIPNATAINEAVEIAKKYEEQKMVSFINGILGAFVRAEFPNETPEKPIK